MRVLVTGAGGQLARDVCAVLAADAHEVAAFDHASLAVEDPVSVDAVMDAVRPDAVIHAAALTNVDRCEEEPDLAEAVNAAGTGHVADAATRVGAHLVYVSTDYVFDGRATRPYRETDRTNPLSVYGRTKLAGERACGERATIVRTSWVAGEGAPNFVATVLALAGASGPLRFVDDQRASPTYTADLAVALAALARDRRPGCFHVTNSGDASRYELAREVLAIAGADPDRVEPISTGQLDPPRPAVRPAYSVLDNGAFESAGYPGLPDWRDGLARLIARLAGSSR